MPYPAVTEAKARPRHRTGVHRCVGSVWMNPQPVEDIAQEIAEEILGPDIRLREQPPDTQRFYRKLARWYLRKMQEEAVVHPDAPKAYPQLELFAC